jgi:hypothetical protein
VKTKIDPFINLHDHISPASADENVPLSTGGRGQGEGAYFDEVGNFLRRRQDLLMCHDYTLRTNAKGDGLVKSVPLVAACLRGDGWILSSESPLESELVLLRLDDCHLTGPFKSLLVFGLACQSQGRLAGFSVAC